MFHLLPSDTFPRFLSLLLLAVLAVPDSADTSAPADSPYRKGQASRDGIGKFYMDREISHVMGHRGAAWLERPTREREERTDLLVEALPLEPGDVVADIGAGTGYFTFCIAQRVPEGRARAVDEARRTADRGGEARRRLAFSRAVHRVKGRGGDERRTRTWPRRAQPARPTVQ